jgi:hypothetical protein
MKENELDPASFAAIILILLIGALTGFSFMMYAAAGYYKKESARLKQHAVDKGYAEMVKLEDGNEGFKWKE